MTYKCWLNLDEGVKANNIKEERLKVVVKGFLEVAIACVLCFSEMKFGFHMLLLIYAIVSIRSIYKEHVDLLALIFFMAYLSQNFIVNIIDYIIFRKAMGYYEDFVFAGSFSYKLF